MKLKINQHTLWLIYTSYRAAIIRRYQGGLTNFFEIYQPICDDWVFINNMYTQPAVVAEGGLGREEEVNDEFLWDKIKTRWK